MRVLAAGPSLLLAACAAASPPPTPCPAVAATASASSSTVGAVASAKPVKPPGELVRPCRAGTPDHKVASDSLDALNKRIQTLGSTSDPKPLAKDLRELLDGPCFALAGPEMPSLDFDTGLSLRTFWEHGGHSWVGYYLSLLDPTPYVWFPPTPRKTLTTESAPGHHLARLLCPADDLACGHETSGWVQRATLAFERYELEAKLSHCANGGAGDCDASPEACLARAKAVAKHEQWDTWRSCTESIYSTHRALPLGQFRAPRDGWLLVRGRRGHYNFCDELRAYDLASGSAYVGRSCSGLVLVTGGGVDGSATDSKRKEEAFTARLPVDALREAAWMVMLAPHAERSVRMEGFGVAIPKGIDPMRPEDSYGGIGLGGFGWSSAQTTLRWSWVVSDKVVANGTFIWPFANDGAEDHATRLVAIAEAPMQVGCAPAALPTKLPLRDASAPVSKLDTTPDTKDAVPERLAQALEALRKKPLCK